MKIIDVNKIKDNSILYTKLNKIFMDIDKLNELKEKYKIKDIKELIYLYLTEEIKDDKIKKQINKNNYIKEIIKIEKNMSEDFKKVIDMIINDIEKKTYKETYLENIDKYSKYIINKNILQYDKEKLLHTIMLKLNIDKIKKTPNIEEYIEKEFGKELLSTVNEEYEKIIEIAKKVKEIEISEKFYHFPLDRYILLMLRKNENITLQELLKEIDIKKLEKEIKKSNYEKELEKITIDEEELIVFDIMDNVLKYVDINKNINIDNIYKNAQEKIIEKLKRYEKENEEKKIKIEKELPENIRMLVKNNKEQIDKLIKKIEQININKIIDSNSKLRKMKYFTEYIIEDYKKLQSDIEEEQKSIKEIAKDTIKNKKIEIKRKKIGLIKNMKLTTLYKRYDITIPEDLTNEEILNRMDIKRIEKLRKEALNKEIEENKEPFYKDIFEEIKNSLILEKKEAEKKNIDKNAEEIKKEMAKKGKNGFLNTLSIFYTNELLNYIGNNLEQYGNTLLEVPENFFKGYIGFLFNDIKETIKSLKDGQENNIQKELKEFQNYLEKGFKKNFELNKELIEYKNEKYTQALIDGYIEYLENNSEINIKQLDRIYKLAKSKNQQDKIEVAILKNIMNVSFNTKDKEKVIKYLHDKILKINDIELDMINKFVMEGNEEEMPPILAKKYERIKNLIKKLDGTEYKINTVKEYINMIYRFRRLKENNEVFKDYTISKEKIELVLLKNNQVLKWKNIKIENEEEILNNVKSQLLLAIVNNNKEKIKEILLKNYINKDFIKRLFITRFKEEEINQAKMLSGNVEIAETLNEAIGKNLFQYLLFKEKKDIINYLIELVPEIFDSDILQKYFKNSYNKEQFSILIRKIKNELLKEGKEDFELENYETEYLEKEKEINENIEKLELKNKQEIEKQEKNQEQIKNIQIKNNKKDLNNSDNKKDGLKIKKNSNKVKNSITKQQPSPSI